MSGTDERICKDGNEVVCDGKCENCLKYNIIENMKEIQMTYDCDRCGEINEIKTVGGTILCGNCGLPVALTDEEMNEYIRLLNNIYLPKADEMKKLKNQVVNVIEYVKDLDNVGAFLFGMVYHSHVLSEYNSCSIHNSDGIDIVDIENGLRIGVISASSPEEAIKKLLDKIIKFRDK